MIYFDYASTSVKRKEIVEKLIENLDLYEGNTSSIHALGRNSNRYLEQARESIAKQIKAKTDKVIFTSGASESNNIVISNFNDEKFEIISSSIEHKSILEPLKNVNSKVLYIDARKDGIVDVSKIEDAITDNTKLVALMYVNNETGVIQPVKEVGELLADKDIWFHVDAVQALGHINIDVEEINCDSLSLSGHKVGGLNGFGVLYLKNRLEPLIFGGNQEFNLRAGTSNVLAAMSMANSLEIMSEEIERINELKMYFLNKLKNIAYEINGDINNSTNHIVNIYFPFVKSDLLITYLDMNKIYVSAGSACNAGSLEPSYVIENMYDKDRARHSIRFSFGFTNTKLQIDKLIEVLEEFYKRKTN